MWKGCERDEEMQIPGGWPGRAGQGHVAGPQSSVQLCLVQRQPQESGRGGRERRREGKAEGKRGPAGLTGTGSAVRALEFPSWLCISRAQHLHRNRGRCGLREIKFTTTSYRACRTEGTSGQQVTWAETCEKLSFGISLGSTKFFGTLATTLVVMSKIPCMGSETGKPEESREIGQNPHPKPSSPQHGRMPPRAKMGDGISRDGVFVLS